MKSVFEQTTRTELIQRINLLDDKKQAQWGKMNAYQMVRHCTLCEEMFTGKIKIKRVFIGRLLGKMVLKKALKNDAPFAMTREQIGFFVYKHADHHLRQFGV